MACTTTPEATIHPLTPHPRAAHRTATQGDHRTGHDDRGDASSGWPQQLGRRTRPLERSHRSPRGAQHEPNPTAHVVLTSSEPITAAIHRENGVVLLLTSAINTHQTPATRPALHRLIRPGDIALGSIARVRSNPDQDQ